MTHHLMPCRVGVVFDAKKSGGVDNASRPVGMPAESGEQRLIGRNDFLALDSEWTADCKSGLSGSTRAP